MPQDDIHRLAHKYMRQAQALGYHAQSMMQDFAIEGLLADGFIEQEANAAVQVIWAAHYTITDSI